MELLTANFRRSRFLTVGGALGGFDPVLSSALVAFYRKADEVVVLFHADKLYDGWWSPLVGVLVQFGVIDGGGEASAKYVTRQLRLLPESVTFSFVGDSVGAANALAAFVQLPPELLERVTEVHLRQFVPLNDSLRRVIDRHAAKVHLIW